MKQRFFDLARKISFKSSYKHKIGAIIVRKGKVMGLGFNACKTHPRSNTGYRQLHAELSAVLNSRLEDFNNCEIYIYRETPGGRIATSKPCIYCMQMLKNLNFSNIYFTDYDGYKNERI